MARTETGKKRKKSNVKVKHTRAVQHDRSQHGGGMPTEAAIKSQLLDIVHPATLAQVGLFQALGLRERSLERNLTLPVMVALAV